MAKQIEGVLEMVLECAKTEFLEKGYKDASLRSIASAAETSTGSIYTRFGDKEGLFRAIVEPVANEMKQMYTEMQERFHGFDVDTQEKELSEYTLREIMKLIDYIYAHFNEFKLLLDASYGTLYQNFVNELVDIEVKYTYLYMQAVGIADKGNTNKELVHIVTTAFMNGMFEIIRHDMDIDMAKIYIKQLKEYHQAGFNAVIFKTDN